MARVWQLQEAKNKLSEVVDEAQNHDLHHNCILATRNETDFAATDVPVINPWT